MKLVEFQNNRYYVVDETADVYICSPYSQLEGYHTISKKLAREIAEEKLKPLPPFKFMYFNIDDSTARYPGYTRGERWNGWACPRFTKEVGLQIAKDTGIEDYFLVFDEENDRFIIMTAIMSPMNMRPLRVQIL
jgi:hypothetical protein